MARVAILKPDHLGDLVLASPAIRATCARYDNVTLFVSSGSCGLAHFLFGDGVEIRCRDLRHLARGTAEVVELEHLVQELNAFDFVVCLRDDPVMRTIMDQITAFRCTVSGSDEMHETSSHKQAVAAIAGDYARTELFSKLPIYWPSEIASVGLCVAAGFPTNRWPNLRWIELAGRLADAGIAIALVGGPGERDDLRLLSRLLAALPHRVLEGGDDFGEFLDALEDVDLVVASDGGTAHICSLRKPVCSIFGSSPWRRYAPFGCDNVVLTREEPCSPCTQFSTEQVNGCLTRECMAAVSAAQVAAVVASNGLDFSCVRGLRIERGVSHRFVTT
jgi:ADP-heptose:LPS heptosyltransferase